MNYAGKLLLAYGPLLTNICVGSCFKISSQEVSQMIWFAIRERNIWNILSLYSLFKQPSHNGRWSNYEHNGPGRTTDLIARFIGPTCGPHGAVRTQVGPMLAPWTLSAVGKWHFQRILLNENICKLSFIRTYSLVHNCNCPVKVAQWQWSVWFETVEYVSGFCPCILFCKTVNITVYIAPPWYLRSSLQNIPKLYTRKQ